MKTEKISPSILKPMLATLVDSPFDDANWIFETKWDGFRIVARILDNDVTLFSRGGKDVTKIYMPVAVALKKFKHTAVVDGELVAFDKNGVSRFQLLQNIRSEKIKLCYCVFDLIFLDGHDLREQPLIKRKNLLKRILPKDRFLKYSEHTSKRGKWFFEKAKQVGLEGIVAKRALGIYHSGQRTREWLKIKTVLRQEVVIVGFTKPSGSRRYFGSLVLAVRNKKGWSYVGRAGTGFDSAALKMIYEKMKPLIGSEKPFDQEIPEENTTTWIKPQLVGEVKFTEWTRDGQMRHPAFVGLRDDKRAVNVTREETLPAKR